MLLDVSLFCFPNVLNRLITKSDIFKKIMIGLTRRDLSTILWSLLFGACLSLYLPFLIVFSISLVGYPKIFLTLPSFVATVNVSPSIRYWAPHTIWKFVGVSRILKFWRSPSRARQRAKLSAASNIQASPVWVEKKTNFPMPTTRLSCKRAFSMMYQPPCLYWLPRDLKVVVFAVSMSYFLPTDRLR